MDPNSLGPISNGRYFDLPASSRRTNLPPLHNLVCDCWKCFCWRELGYVATGAEMRAYLRQRREAQDLIDRD